MTTTGQALFARHYYMLGTWGYRNEQSWQKPLPLLGFHLVLAYSVLGHQSAHFTERLMPSVNEISWSFKSTLSVLLYFPFFKYSCLTWSDFKPSFSVYALRLFYCQLLSDFFLQCFLTHNSKESPYESLYPKYFPFQCIAWVDARIIVFGKYTHHRTLKEKAGFMGIWPVYLHRA